MSDEPQEVAGPYLFLARTDFSIRCLSPSWPTKAYRGTIHIGQLQGLFRIRPLEESRAFPEVGYYRQEQELLDYGSNEFLLRSISDFTGGRFNPTPKQIFDTAGRSEAQPAIVAGPVGIRNPAESGGVDHAQGSAALSSSRG